MSIMEDFNNICKDQIKVCCENCKFRVSYNYCKLQSGKNIGSPRSHKCKKFKQK
jgi:hypothetical protein